MPWHKILQTARYTPSPHNVQPWKVRIIDDTSAELYIDRSRTLPAEDTTGSFITSAMGMFLEALRIVSLNEGLAFRYELADGAEPAEMTLFARLSLKPNPSAKPVYSNEIFLKRRTSRLSSKPQAIPADVVKRLSALAREWGQKFDIVEDQADIREFMEQNITAVFHDLNDPPYRDEIVSWFRYSAGEGAAKKDGLEARCMIIPPAEFFFFAKFPPVLQLSVFSSIARKHYRKRVGYVHTLGFISGPFFDNSAALRSGAFLINVWLEMAKHNLFIHPFGNLVTNQSANRWIHEKMGFKNIWLVFRIGYCETAPQSHRLNLEDILLD